MADQVIDQFLLTVMPPLSNQFSLSLELTRVFPIAATASNAVMKMARSLQSSGSDIVTEEDLATIFGKCRISPQMATGFRKMVGTCNSTSLNSALGFTLEAGPGPTVNSSLLSTCVRELTVRFLQTKGPSRVETTGNAIPRYGHPVLTIDADSREEYTCRSSRSVV